MHRNMITAHPPKMPRRFLVVDDDEAFRTRLVRAMKGRGYEAHGAGSANEALEVARKVHPDAATVDLRMPQVSGLDLVPQLLAQQPGIEVVVLTGYGNIPTAVEAVRRGATNYLTKPLDTDQILAAFDHSGDPHPPPEAGPSLALVEWEHIQRVLHDCHGNLPQTARK